MAHTIHLKCWVLWQRKCALNRISYSFSQDTRNTICQQLCSQSGQCTNSGKSTRSLVGGDSEKSFQNSFVLLFPLPWSVVTLTLMLETAGLGYLGDSAEQSAPIALASLSRMSNKCQKQLLFCKVPEIWLNSAYLD